ncbi:general substrate transporter [Trichoderma evansii]
MAIAAACAAIGGGLTAGSVHIVMLIIVRILQGFGLGLTICLVSLYLTEVAPARQRGLLSSMTVCSLGGGYLICDLVAVGTYSSTNATLQWRLPLALASVGAVCLLGSLCFIPESPRYLAWVDRHEDAWTVVRRLHHDPDNPDEAAARSVLDQIIRQVAYDKEQNAGYKHMIANPSLRKRTLLLCKSINWGERSLLSIIELV